jgi:hypothetical protein
MEVTMSRRDDHKRTRSGKGWLRAAWAAILVAAASFSPSYADEGLPMKTDAYYLSPNNPLATADQRDLEAKALEIIKAPAVQQAKETARNRWKMIVASLHPDAEAWSRFDTFLDEFVLHYTLKALNSDPSHPRVVRYNMLPHTWFGHSVGGTRQGGGDNIDNTYALIPMEHGATYELSVQRFEPQPADVTWSLMGDLMPMITLGVLEGRDMVADADGRFTVTVDDKPPNGRVNHIQTQPDTRFLFIRETRSDWRQVPAGIRVKRITPPRMAPLTDEQIVARAARYVLSEIPNTYYWTVVVASTTLNSITPPVSITGLGGLVTQQTSFGRAQLGDDDALVVTVNGGGAGYYSLVLYDFWFNAIEYADHTSTLNNAQVVPNADGTTTYVISQRDPGVHNWIDPAGVRSTFIVHRWQELPRVAGAHAPASLSTRLVKFAELSSALPAGMRTVTPEQRRAQLAQRRAEYDLRFVH